MICVPAHSLSSHKNHNFQSPAAFLNLYLLSNFVLQRCTKICKIKPIIMPPDNDLHGKVFFIAIFCKVQKEVEMFDE